MATTTNQCVLDLRPCCDKVATQGVMLAPHTASVHLQQSAWHKQQINKWTRDQGVTESQCKVSSLLLIQPQCHLQVVDGWRASDPRWVPSGVRWYFKLLRLPGQAPLVPQQVISIPHGLYCNRMCCLNNYECIYAT